MQQIWPIGGGKGGTGKSFVTGSLGILLAREGYHTLLVDLDLGAANLHTTVGVPSGETSLSDFVNKKVKSLNDTIVCTPTPNLFLIGGAMNDLDIANLAHEQKMKILRDISKLSFDYILLDLGAGTSFNTIDFFLISNMGIFVTMPEPTATENIYRLIRSVYFRKIRQLLNVHHFRSLAREAEQRNSKATVTNPDLLLHVISELDPEKGKMLEEALSAMEFSLLMNQHRRQDNSKIGEFICMIIENHLSLKMHFLGNVAFDEHVHRAICEKRPFLDLSPHSKTSLDLKSCFKKMQSLSDTSSVPSVTMA